MDTTRQQVQLSDLPEFDRRVAPIKQDALEAVLSFRELQRHYSQKTNKSRNNYASAYKGTVGGSGGYFCCYFTLL